jgi:hypothetical protein
MAQTQPVSPSQTPGANSIYLSGLGATIPASGVIGGSGSPSGGEEGIDGPWFIERQNLKIDYVRLPNFSPSSDSVNLSATTCGYKVTDTFLQSKVTAFYSIEKSYDSYDTTAFTQPQTFEFHPNSTDSYGNSYGSVGVSSLGPAGNVDTKQEWYNRRYWVSTDSETVSSIVGMRHFYWHRLPVNPDGYLPGSFHWGDFERTLPQFYKGTFLDSVGLYLHPASHTDYSLPGTYHTGLETPIAIINYVDQMGMFMTTKKYYLDWWFPWYFIAEPTLNVGIPEYSTTRHSW